MKTNSITCTILAVLFVLSVAITKANAQASPDTIKYKEISSEKFFAKGDLSKMYSTLNGYKITDVFIKSITNNATESVLNFSDSITSHNIWNADIADYCGKMNSNDSTCIERLNEAIVFTDFDKQYQFNGKYTLYVYFEKGNKSKIFLHNIEGIPTQEEIDTAKIKKQELIYEEEAKQKAASLAKEEIDVGARKALEKPLYTGTLILMHAGQNQKIEFHIAYNDVADSCFIYTKYIPQSNGFIPAAPNTDVNHKLYVTLDDFETLKKALTKYKEWLKIAKENQAIIGDPNLLGKEIPDLNIHANVVQDVHSKAPLVGEMHDNLSFSKKLSFRVISNDAETHLLLIMVGEQTAETSTTKAHIMMFAEPWADDLLAYLEKNKIADTVSKIKAEINKKKEKQEKDKSLFN